ncbi:RNA-BINDING PROTEIN 34 [Salix koriyanagi]|uniref:RNA-BINDING PROTEIN 34 n=1 Tax=Salix koriyanagi TaxID=2511006 RepID=A0A9Q0PWT1_9ROSI|nr:RNA-BINDING PROTEIN 34 [Salix koriyanagi]
MIPISNESPGANADIQDPDFNGTAVKPKKVNTQNPNLGLEPKEEKTLKASLAHNMAVVGRNHIRVDRACPPRKKLKGAADTPLYDNRRTVFVGNLPYDVKEAANLVIKKRNTKLPDRELRASHARQESTPSKRRNSFAGDTANMSNKKLATDSRTPDRNNRPDTKVSRSDQGLRASKSGIEKKVPCSRTCKTPWNSYGEIQDSRRKASGEKTSCCSKKRKRLQHSRMAVLQDQPGKNAS